MNLYKLIVKPAILLLRAVGNSFSFTTDFSSPDNNYIRITKYYKGGELDKPNFIEIYDYSEQLPFLEEIFPIDQYDSIFARTCMGKSILTKVRPKCTNVSQLVCTFISNTVYPMTNCIIDAVNQFIRSPVSELQEPDLPEWLFKEVNSLNPEPVVKHKLSDNIISFAAPSTIRLPREVEDTQQLRVDLKKLVENNNPKSPLILTVTSKHKADFTQCLGNDNIGTNIDIRKIKLGTSFVSQTAQGQVKLAQCAVNDGDIFFEDLLIKDPIKDITNLLSSKFTPLYIRINSQDGNTVKNEMIGGCLNSLVSPGAKFISAGSSRGYSTTTAEGFKIAHHCIIPQHASLSGIFLYEGVSDNYNKTISNMVLKVVAYDKAQAQKPGFSAEAINILTQAAEVIYNESRHEKSDRVGLIIQEKLSAALNSIEQTTQYNEPEITRTTTGWHHDFLSDLIKNILIGVASAGLLSTVSYVVAKLVKKKLLCPSVTRNPQNTENSEDNNPEHSQLVNIQLQQYGTVERHKMVDKETLVKHHDGLVERKNLISHSKMITNTQGETQASTVVEEQNNLVFLNDAGKVSVVVVGDGYSDLL